MGLSAPLIKTVTKTAVMRVEPHDAQSYQEKLTNLINGEASDGWFLKHIFPVNCDGWTKNYQMIFEKNEFDFESTNPGPL